MTQLLGRTHVSAGGDVVLTHLIQPHVWPRPHPPGPEVIVPTIFDFRVVAAHARNMSQGYQQVSLWLGPPDLQQTATYTAGSLMTGFDDLGGWCVCLHPGPQGPVTEPVSWTGQLDNRPSPRTLVALFRRTAAGDILEFRAAVFYPEVPLS